MASLRLRWVVNTFRRPNDVFVVFSRSLRQILTKGISPTLGLVPGNLFFDCFERSAANALHYAGLLPSLHSQGAPCDSL